MLVPFWHKKMRRVIPRQQFRIVGDSQKMAGLSSSHFGCQYRARNSEHQTIEWGCNEVRHKESATTDVSMDSDEGTSSSTPMKALNRTKMNKKLKPIKRK